MDQAIAAIGMACLAMAGIVLLLGLGVVAAWEIRAINRLRARPPWPPWPPAGPFFPQADERQHLRDRN